MKKAFTTAIALCSLALVLMAWSPQGKMAAQTEERNVGEYEAIAVAGWFDVVLVDGKEGRITLEGKANTIKNIHTEVRKGKLIVEWDKDINLNPFNSLSKVTITIPVEEINGVSLAGSGSVVSDTKLKSDDFYATLSGSGTLDLELETASLSSGISGSGKAILSGSTDEYEVSISGSGDVKAFDLKAKDVSASISGSAKIKVHAANSLTARVSGSGDVEYSGSATKIDSKVSGSGSVTKA